MGAVDLIREIKELAREMLEVIPTDDVVRMFDATQKMLTLVRSLEIVYLRRMGR